MLTLLRRFGNGSTVKARLGAPDRLRNPACRTLNWLQGEVKSQFSILKSLLLVCTSKKKVTRCRYLPTVFLQKPLINLHLSLVAVVHLRFLGSRRLVIDDNQLVIRVDPNVVYSSIDEEVILFIFVLNPCEVMSPSVDFIAVERTGINLVLLDELVFEVVVAALIKLPFQEYINRNVDRVWWATRSFGLLMKFQPKTSWALKK